MYFCFVQDGAALSEAKRINTDQFDEYFEVSRLAKLTTWGSKHKQRPKKTAYVFIVYGIALAYFSTKTVFTKILEYIDVRRQVQLLFTAFRG